MTLPIRTSVRVDRSGAAADEIHLQVLPSFAMAGEGRAAATPAYLAGDRAGARRPVAEGRLIDELP